MKTPKERLDMLVEHTGLKLGAIAKKCGYERPQAFYDVYKGKAKKISEKMASSIIKVFPDIREVWLLTGEGEMTLPVNSLPSREFNPKTTDMTMTRLLESIERKDRQMDELISQQGRLITIIENLSGVPEKQSEVG